MVSVNVKRRIIIGIVISAMAVGCSSCEKIQNRVNELKVSFSVSIGKDLPSASSPVIDRGGLDKEMEDGSGEGRESERQEITKQEKAKNERALDQNLHQDIFKDIIEDSQEGCAAIAGMEAAKSPCVVILPVQGKEKVEMTEDSN